MTGNDTHAVLDPDPALRQQTGGDDLTTLPTDLSELDGGELESARDARDERVGTLFRRWPKLSRFEMRELKRLYGERLRLARYLGRRRRDTKPTPS